MNETLKRIYSLHPSIASWARSGQRTILWNSDQTAKRGISEYIGPTASDLILNSLHIDGVERDFVRSMDALNAIYAVIDAIYHPEYKGRKLVDGFFVEDTGANPK